MSVSTLAQLAHLFQASCDGERKVEVCRQILTTQADFDPFSAFRAIDQGHKGYLEADDLAELVRSLSRSCALEDLGLLVTSMSSSSRISMSAFNLLVLPRDKDGARSLCTTRIVPSYVSFEVKLALVRVIERELEFLRLMEKLKLALQSRTDFEVSSCFREIDSLGLGSISRSELLDFMEAQGVPLLEKDIEALYSRWDLDRDSRLSYAEFVAAIKPVRNYLQREEDISVKEVADKEMRFSTPDKKPKAQGFSTVTTKRSEADYLSPEQEAFEDLPVTVKAFSNRISLFGHSNKPVEGLPMTQRASSGSRPDLVSEGKAAVVSVFKHQIDLAAELDEVRVRLALQSDFSLWEAFKLFSRGDYLTLADLEATAAHLGQIVLRQELMLLIRHYDSNNDGRLQYSDFCQMFAPREQAYRSLVLSRSPASSSHPPHLSPATKVLLGQALRLHLECEAAEESLRRKLYQRMQVDLHSVFSELDLDQDGFLVSEELGDALRAQGERVTESDLEELVRRYDSDLDGRVSFIEFVGQVTPRSPSKLH